MALPPLKGEDVLMLTMHSQLAGQTCLTVLHYGVASPPAIGDHLSQMSDLLKFIDEGENNLDLAIAFPNAQGTNLLYKELRCQVVHPYRSNYVLRPIQWQGKSTMGGAFTSNVAASLWKKSDLGGRMGNGRVQLPGPPSTAMANGLWTNPYFNGPLDGAAEAVMQVIRPQPFGGVYAPVIYNPKAPVQKYCIVLDCIPQDTVRTMYRRTVRVGI